MTSVHEPFALASIASEALSFSDVCVKPGPSPTTVIVTHGHMSASLVEIGDGHPVKVKTWHTSHSQPFTCPVVYDATRDKYVAVSRKVAVLLSPESTEATAKRQTFPLPAPVFRLLPRTDQEPIIVLQNGLCTTVAHLSAHGAADDPKLNPNEKLVHAEIAGTDDSSTTVLQVASVTSTKEHRCRLLKLRDAEFYVDFEENLSASRSARSFCLVNGEVVVLATDGTLSLLSKSGLRAVGSMPGFDGDKAASVTALDSKRLLVVSGDHLYLWNVAFMTLEASRVLRFPVTRTSFLPSGFVCFEGSKSSVGSTLMCAPVTLKPPVLCQAVGLGAQPGGDKMPAVSVLAKTLLSEDKDPEQILRDIESVADDIPETELVSLLRRLLSTNSKLSGTEDTLLKKLLRCPHNCDVLANHLREGLPFDKACALVVYLLDFLEGYSLADAEDTSVGKALDWVACILDAHFAQFSMSKEDSTGELMEHLMAVMARIQGLFSDLGEVEQWLLVLSKRVELLKFDDRGLYTIEMFEI
ncbi:unnamed protein product [Ixodes pacificus]